jgi:serine protease AprX
MIKVRSCVSLVSLASFTLLAAGGPAPITPLPTSSPAVVATATAVIVQASSLAAARDAVRAIGGETTHELGLIDAVGARLDARQERALRARPELRIYADAAVEVATGGGGGNQPINNHTVATHFPTLVGANGLHNQGIDGFGVSIAVVDTGYWKVDGLGTNRYGLPRVLVQYDAIGNELDSLISQGHNTDDNGHGSHVTGIILDSSQSPDGKYRGVAPGAFLVSIKAFGEDGRGSYASIIRGLDWAVTWRHLLNIRVLNLSFAAPPQSYYWDDPLNQAVMKAWKAGIVVVAAAGNNGPDPLTIGVPGNVPYVITVGAMTDNWTPSNGYDDRMASFSSAGPTVEGFVKPEMVAPGGHVAASMRSNSLLAEQHPEAKMGDSRYWSISGTSQSSAVVSGVVALMVQEDPWLTPNEVKCRLTASAKRATAGGQPGYGVFQQGAGLVNATKAVASTLRNCGNQGLNLTADLAGTTHYGGPARRDGAGNYYVLAGGQATYVWDGDFHATAYPWVDANGAAYPWVDNAFPSAYPWVDSTAYPWVDSAAYPWVDAATTFASVRPNGWMGEIVEVNPWVAPE